LATHPNLTATRHFRLIKTDAEFIGTLAPTILTRSFLSLIPHRAPTSEKKEATIAAVGPLASARIHRWVDAPSSSGSSTEPYPRVPSWSNNDDGSCSHSDHDARARSGGRWLRIYPQRRAAASDRASSHRGAGERRTDGVAFYLSDAWIQPGPTVVVARNNMKIESPKTLIPSIRSSPIFFYPNSDLCPSPAQLIPLIGF
jgi:hypothetical protein